MNVQTGRFVWAILFGLIATAAQAQRALAPLPVEAAAGALELVPTFSVSTTSVAYVLRDARRREVRDEPWAYFVTSSGASEQVNGGDIWITNIVTGETKNITRGKGNNWSPVWSPDGKRLAFFSDRDGRPRLWVWSVLSGKLSRVSDAVIWTRFSHERASWTPDGSSVLVKLVPQGKSIEGIISSLLQRGSSGWARPIIPKEESSGAMVKIYKSSGKSFSVEPKHQTNDLGDSLVDEMGDLAIIRISDGTVDRLARNVATRWYTISPDGSLVGYSVLTGIDRNSQQNRFDISVISLRDKKERLLARNVQQGWGFFSWSPDSKTLVYTAAGINDAEVRGDCFIVQVDEGKPRNLTTGQKTRFGTNESFPLWDAAGKVIYLLGGDALWRVAADGRGYSQVGKIPGKTLLLIVGAEGGRFWAPDGEREIFLLTRDDRTKQQGFYSIDLDSGKYLKLLEEDRTYSAPLGYHNSSGGGWLVYLSEDAGRPPDLWVSDQRFTNPRQITNANPQFDKYVMGKTILIKWQSIHGQDLKGTLMLPAGYEEGKRYPLIVWVYGGAYGSDSLNRFGIAGSKAVFNMQVLATRGYAIFYPDTPLRVGTPMKDIAASVLSGVDKAIELGFADPQRLGVMGQSYGGYSTLALIVQTTRFKAAVASALPPSNILTSYGYMANDGQYGGYIGYLEKGSRGMGGSPWQYRQRFIENSPYFFFDQVQTPLLMALGTVDRLPLAWGDETFVALSRLEKDVEYLRYGGEAHVIQGYANVLDFWNRRLVWFEKHLKPDEALPEK